MKNIETKLHSPLSQGDNDEAVARILELIGKPAGRHERVNMLLPSNIDQVPQHSADLPPETIRNIARGHATPEDIEALNVLTESRNRSVLDRLEYDVSQGFNKYADLAFVHSMGRIIDQAQQENPQEYRTAWTYPFSNAFASRVSELLTDKGSLYRMDEAVATRVAYVMGAMVAAVAIRCNMPSIPCDLAAYARQGQLVLPSLGVHNVPEDIDHVLFHRSQDGQISIRNEQVGFRAVLPYDLSCETPDWLPVRTLEATVDDHTLATTLDDTHYNRSMFAEDFTSRLPPKVFDRWQERFQGAWDILFNYVPVQALAAAGILRTIVPFKKPAQGVFTASHSGIYGGTAMSLPPTPMSFAKEILHETAHNQLDKLAEIIGLHNVLRLDNRRYYSGWRKDPRPLSGHVHGVYAHSILAAFCAIVAEYGTNEEERRRFAIEFARLRAQVRVGIVVLKQEIAQNTDPLSNTFLTDMVESVEELEHHPVRPWLENLAQDEAIDHYAAWILANRQVDPKDIDMLASHFMANVSPGGSLHQQLTPIDSLPQAKYVPPRDTRRLFAKRQLFDLYQNEPGLFKTLYEKPGGLSAFPGTTTADLALVSGYHIHAMHLYERSIQHNPHSTVPWPGFLTALRHCCSGRADTTSSIYIRPDILHPLYGQITKRRAERNEPPINPSDFVLHLITMVKTLDEEERHD